MSKLALLLFAFSLQQKKELVKHVRQVLIAYHTKKQKTNPYHTKKQKNKEPTPA